MPKICKDLDKVKPELKRKVEHMLAVCKSKGMSVFVFETTRTKERQKMLVAQGKSRTMKSKHITGDAVDIVFLVNGQPSWDSSCDWARLGRIGKLEGLKWGGDFVGFFDAPHFQLP
jgi:peptidoglycan L-alanyl-D-glutamate endopeptidase CwlK